MDTNRVQQYLDGELPLEALSAEERAAAGEWDALLSEARALRDVAAPGWIETRVMARLPAQPRRSWLPAVVAWVTRPQPVRVRPIYLGFIGAAAVLVLFLARGREAPTGPLAVDSAANIQSVAAVEPAIIYVEFVFADRAARTVTIAGDFNGWNVQATPLMDTDGDGVWTGRVALRPGLHKYMFVVDGEKWVTDPQADSYVDDGFGMRNAVVTVAQPSRKAI